jgi:hypothetical protein
VNREPRGSFPFWPLLVRLWLRYQDLRVRSTTGRDGGSLRMARGHGFSGDVLQRRGSRVTLSIHTVHIMVVPNESHKGAVSDAGCRLAG